ncbi:MAG: hypothetical protein V7786_01815 [Sulfitobacter litoralis]|uniref:hypothetical protein n=1 Tax=Sulfitobacter litoralis TaxID=335975 RepID=UPI00300385EC
MSVDVSGSAFPVSNGVDTDWGMTLRDYFAAASIQGLRSNPHAWAEMTADEMVEAAWKDADAMLKAREATS